MDTLTVIIVGQDLFKMVEEKFELVGLNKVNRVNKGMLGNLKMLTYEFDLDESEIIQTRKLLMREICEDSRRMEGYFKGGEWMTILVMKPLCYTNSHLKQGI